jgi:hypothetical protein
MKRAAQSGPFVGDCVQIAAGSVDLSQRELVIIGHERNHAGKEIGDWSAEPAVNLMEDSGHRK